MKRSNTSQPVSDTRQTLVNHNYPDANEIGVLGMHATYIQNTDDMDDGPCPYQLMTLESVAGDGFEPDTNIDAFIRMKIGRTRPDQDDVGDFWSIIGPEDLIRVFNDFERRRGSTIRYSITRTVTKPDGTKEETIYD